MKRFWIPLLVVFATTPVAAAELALVGATVHDGRGGPVLADAVIHVEGDRIVCVGSRTDCPLTEQVDTVDLGGRHITPGLVDGHVHYAQTGWLDGRPDSGIGTDHYDYEALQQSLRDDPGRWHRAYLCSGVTAVYDVGGLPWTLDVGESSGDAANRPHYQAAGPLITHYEPVFGVISALGTDSFLSMASDDAALESVSKLVEMGARAIKVWYLDLDPPKDQRDALDKRLKLIGEAAREAGLPLIVHATELRNAKAALRAGASMLVHSVEDRLVDEEFIELLRETGADYAPTLTVGANWRRAVSSVVLGLTPPPVDDPNNCVDERTREVIAEADTLGSSERVSSSALGRVFAGLESAGASQAIARLNLARVFQSGASIVTSTDAGNPLTVHGPSIYAEIEAMESAGIPPSEILVMSTRNGAAAMGRLDDFGTLEAGKLADLIVLEDDPSQSARAYRSITHVMRVGELSPVSEFSAR
ncbi:amidohydrolase family protein [Wenzhouxiangella sp. XN201]|uniref:amidohydrolase family protein n=1 Tax=Wenzhouxiangella sp. XN201 TaxID=2710755 RepID=UPI0013CC02A4|nr:amidohydrolase family protein [Wenzhouxiangella sp. XN201]NEZ02570.1 amidohydrolase family protein [Wenzhouxiangella sp. XN201]